MPNSIIIIANISLAYIFITIPVVYHKFIRKASAQKVYIPRICEYILTFFFIICAVGAIIRINNIYNPIPKLSFGFSILAICISILTAVVLPIVFYYASKPLENIEEALSHLELSQEAMGSQYFNEATNEMIKAMNLLRGIEVKSEEINEKLNKLRERVGMEE